MLVHLMDAGVDRPDLDALRTERRNETRVGRAATCAFLRLRADELALRLKYAGFDTDRIEVIPDLKASLKKATANASSSKRLFALPTYTALLELRELLADQDSAGRYWQS